MAAALLLALRSFLVYSPGMASNSDPAQLKKFGLILLGLGVLMAVVGIWTGVSWQLYGGIGAAVLGLVVAGMAFMKK